MMVDLLLHSAAQVITCASPDGPKRGAAMRDVGLHVNAAIAIDAGRIVAVGPSTALRAQVQARMQVDCSGRVLLPGFVEPHTHLVFAGDRVDEWERKLAGATYLDILAAGGGILSTMRATRAAGEAGLLQGARTRLDTLLANGVTTCEIKTGYGLNLADELKMLRVIQALAASHPCDVLPTLLAAHTIPPEFKDNSDGYVALIEKDIIPAAAHWFDTVNSRHKTPLGIDVFCEQGAFSPDQATRVLVAGRKHGMRVTAHVDQFNSLGGVAAALAQGACSVDHLDATTAEDRARIAASEAVAVVLPAVTFHLGSHNYANARAMIDAGCALALSTDMNPGSAPCLSPSLVMAIACRQQKLSPAEVLNAVTINAAHALGIADRCGSLEPGKQADVLSIAASDYRHLAYQFGGNLVAQVYKRGQQVWPA